MCHDSTGEFQGPAGSDCSVEAAFTKVELAGRLLQCVTAELLWEAGQGRASWDLLPGVTCHTSNLTIKQSHALSQVTTPGNLPTRYNHSPFNVTFSPD